MAVEIASPSDLLLAGRGLVGRPFVETLQHLRQNDSAVETYDCGATAYAIGVGIYCPDACKSPESLIESAIAFRKGYYDL